MTEFAFALLLTVFAGLSTAVGGALGVVRSPSTRALSAGLGLSAGVMLYVSLVEILPAAQRLLTGSLGSPAGSWAAVASFFGGIAFIALIDRLVPEEVNPHEPSTIQGDARQRALMRTGLVTASVLMLHNFPEGFATFIAALQDPSIAIPIAFAIAIHNIPEGLAVAIPIHHATGSRLRAFGWAAVSGLAEPIGALVGYLLLRPFLSGTLFGVVFAGIAGIMVFISLDELLPTAEEYGEHHLAIYGVVAGMAIMASSLVLFE